MLSSNFSINWLDRQKIVRATTKFSKFLAQISFTLSTGLEGLAHSTTLCFSLSPLTLFILISICNPLVIHFIFSFLQSILYSINICMLSSVSFELRSYHKSTKSRHLGLVQNVKIFELNKMTMLARHGSDRFQLEPLCNIRSREIRGSSTDL